MSGQGNDDKFSNEEISVRYMEKSRSALDAAKYTESNFPGTAVEKAYYSVFYAAHSLLALRGVKPKSHEGVNHKLGELFTKTGLLPKEIFRLLRDLEVSREKATYDLAESYTTEEAHERILKAEVFINAVKRLTEDEKRRKDTADTQAPV
ncbi:MAG: HEPN domain-containing protein [Synergistaceae bacterium]|jgi:uncharacterized protein (UPF0332 family)|nr:HEPN domain-containing protein [Synergistaceae bacterium]